MFGAMQSTNAPVKEFAEEAIMDTAVPTTAEALPKAAPYAQEIITKTSTTEIILWFLAGAAIAISLYLLIDWFRNRKK